MVLARVLLISSAPMGADQVKRSLGALLMLFDICYRGNLLAIFAAAQFLKDGPSSTLNDADFGKPDSGQRSIILVIMLIRGRLASVIWVLCRLRPSRWGSVPICAKPASEIFVL